MQDALRHISWQLLGACNCAMCTASGCDGEDMEAESGSEAELAEVVITSGSMLDHTSLNAQQFTSRFNLLPIAVHSGSTGVELKGDIASKTLNPGDVVLVQGSVEAIENLNTNSNMLVIENDDLDLGTKRSFVPLYIMVAVAALAASNLLPCLLYTSPSPRDA